MELEAKRVQDMDISRPCERATCISLFERKGYIKVDIIEIYHLQREKRKGYTHQ